MGQASFDAAVTAGSTASFSVAANAGFSISLSSVSAYNVRRSSSGPTTGQWQYRVGGGEFVNIGAPITWGTVTTGTGNPQTAIDLTSIVALQSVTPGAVVEFRIVNYGASGTGTWYLNSLSAVGADFVLVGAVNSASPDAPTISSFTPSSGALGATVTITGTNFNGATAVAFNSLAAASFSVVNATTITAAVPAGARTGRITVTTANGTATSSSDFIPLDGSGTVALQNGGAGSFSGKNLFGRALSGQTVRLVYAPPAAGTVEGLRVTVPTEFGAPLSSNVSVSGTGSAGAVVGVAGQVVTITGLSASSLNTINVDISGLSTPDTSTPITNTGRYAFSVDSRGSGGTFAALATQPSASVLIPLANARNADPTTFVPALLNQLVAVEGVCLVGRLGTGSTSTMLQDGNLGIALYSLSAVTGPQTRGNRYAAVGTIAQFNGVVQVVLSDPALLVDLGAATEPAPTTVSVTEFNANGVAYQSRVIRIENLSFVSGTWAVGQNVILQDPSANQVTIRIQQNSTATTAPTFPVTITGIGGQFDNASPFNTGFQLQPRDPADLNSATLPTISVTPSSISNLTATQGSFGASTNFTASASNLTNNITVTANDAVNFAISTNNSDFTNTFTLPTNATGGLSNTPVYIRLTGAAPAGAKSNTVSLVSGSISTNVAVTGTVLDTNAPLIEAIPNSLSGFTTLRGTFSTNQTVTVTGTNLGGTNITVTSSNNFYEISTNSFADTTNSLLLAPTGGVVAVRISSGAPATNSLLGSLALSGGGATNSVVLSGSVTNLPPAVTVSTNILPAFSSVTNTASAPQSFFAQGTNLSANVTVTAPTGFSVAFTSNNADFGTSVTLTNSGGVATNREVFVRMNASATTNALSTRDVTLVTTGASNQVSVSGTIAAASPSLSATPASLTNFFAVAGTPSLVTNYILRGSNLSSPVSIAAPAGFQVALTNTSSAFTNTLSITNNGSISNSIWVRVSANSSTNANLTGNITNSAGALVTNVALQARVVPSPTLSAVPTALSNFSTSTGIASTNQSFNLTASNLLGPVSMTVTNGYEISLNPSNGFSTSLSVSLAAASDNASNYGSGSTNTAIAFVGSEAGSPVQNWSDPIVAKSYATGGNLVYGTAGYYQIRPTPSASPSDVSQGVSAGNDVGISATNNPTLYSMPAFAASVTGGAGNFVNFGPYPVFSGPNASALFRQGALSVSVNEGPYTTPAGTNASYFGVPFQFTMATSGSFRIGLVVDAVADGTYAPNYVGLYSAATGTVFSAALVRDGTPDMIFFDVNAKAGDTFTVGLWQNTGTQSVAALSLVTFDSLPATAAGWTNGANGGTGFGPWAIANTGNASAAIGDPATASITGMGTNAFRLGGTTGYTDAERTFDSPLRVGERFSMQWGNNFDTGGAGNKGFNIYASVGTNRIEMFNVNMGGNATITISGQPMFTNYGRAAITLNFEYVATNTVRVYGIGRDGIETYDRTFTNVAGPPSAIKLYAGLFATNFVQERTPYADNLQITYAGGSITNLPVYVRLATNAPVSEPANSLLSRVSIASPGGASGSSAGSLSVVNGDFQNRTGLTQSSPEWWNGVPTGWTGVNTNFTVRELDPVPSGNFAANLNTLTTASPFVSLYQAVGTLSTASIVSLNFELIPLIAPTTMSAGIFNTQNSTNYNNWTALALPASAFDTSGFHTLSTSVAIAAGTPIGIAFWQGGGSPGAPAIDNVSVSPSGNSRTFVSLSGSVIDRPSVAVSTNSITNLITTNGYFSAPADFTITGRNLSNNVTLAVTPTNANNFQVSTNGLDWTNFLSFAPGTNRAVSNSVQVRITATAPVTNALAGSLAVATDGALSGANISLLGIVLPDTNIPVVTASAYALSGLGSVQGSPGTSTNFAVSGTFLRGPITVAATNSFIAVSTNNLDFGSAVSVPRDGSNQVLSNTVYVRITEFAPVSANTNVFLGNLVLGTTRNSNNLPASTNVAVSGTVTNWSIANPYGIRVTNPVDFVSTIGTNFTFRGQIGAAVDRDTLSWFNLLNNQSNNFGASTDLTWSVSAPLGIGNNTFVFKGQFLTNSGVTNVASDTAGDSAYAPPGGWVSGDNGGYGFGSWELYAEEGLSALYRTDEWASTNMNVSAFNGFAFESLVGAVATAYRPFLAPIQAPGGSFSVRFDSNDLEPGGAVGMQLVSSNQTPLFTFAASNNGSGPAYQISDATNAAVNPGWPYTQSGLLLRFEMTSSNAYSLTVTGSNFTNTSKGTISDSSVAGVTFFTEGAGPVPAANFYVGQMMQNRTIYEIASVETVAPDVERTSAPPATAYDLWAGSYGLNPAGNGAPTADPDKDGFVNDMEFAFGTSPVLANGALLNVTQSDGSMVVTFLARIANVSYSVMQKANLDTSVPAWAETGIVPTAASDQSGVPADYQRRLFSVPASGQNFYRVRAAFNP